LSSHFIPEFAQAMRELAPKGRSAQPVKSQFGWHLIEVLEVRARPFPAYEQVRERIVQILRKRKADAGPTPTRP
jgi:peptidyl-prolyl cis-trans isomerase C